MAGTNAVRGGMDSEVCFVLTVMDNGVQVGVIALIVIIVVMELMLPLMRRRTEISYIVMSRPRRRILAGMAGLGILTSRPRRTMCAALA